MNISQIIALITAFFALIAIIVTALNHVDVRSDNRVDGIRAELTKRFDRLQDNHNTLRDVVIDMSRGHGERITRMETLLFSPPGQPATGSFRAAQEEGIQ